MLKQFVAGYEQSLKSRQNAQGGLVLGAPGIDFRRWLKNPRNEGEAQVGDAKTIKVTGAADVAQVIADLDKIADKASKLPGAGGRVPSQLTPQQKQRATEALKALNVTVYTGVDDQILAATPSPPTSRTPSPRSTRRFCWTSPSPRSAPTRSSRRPPTPAPSPSSCRRSTPPASPISASAAPPARRRAQGPVGQREQRRQVRRLHRGHRERPREGAQVRRAPLGLTS